MYETLRVEINGLTPTLMHNGQLSDPLNEWSKAIKSISAKGKKKTEADIAEMQRLEWMGGLYTDEDGEVCWPGQNIQAMIRTAAKATKQGKDVQRGLQCGGNWKLKHDGPKDMERLFADQRYRLTNSVKVGQARVIRCRPRFPVWSLKFELEYLPDQLNKADIRTFLDYSGVYVALSDWRPYWGRFEVVDMK